MSRVPAVVPLALEVDEEFEEVNLQTGKRRPAVLQTHTPETVEAMRQGYVCFKCWERQAAPFPAECVVCKYPMRDRQAQDFAEAYQGQQRIGPDRDKILQEDEEREWMQKRLDSGLWLPGDPI